MSDEKQVKSVAEEENINSKKRVTIYDLARHTGFSPGTVSRVLNNKDRVKAETRERILAAAKELDLKPQVSVRSRQVAIISEPSFTDRIEGYAATLNAHLSFAFSKKNIGVMIPSDPIEQLPNLFLDGIVAVTFDAKTLAFLETLEDRVPVVYMDRFDGVLDRQYRVCSDHYRSGVIAADCFIAHGKKRLAFFGGEGAAFKERLQGYRDRIASEGLPLDESLFVLARPGSHSAVVTRLVKKGADCIYVPGTSYQALECLHLLSYVMGLSVPEDVSIIGGENDGVSQLLSPPLTTIEEPLREMAERAATVLDKLTSGRVVKDRSCIMPVRLIERNSVQ